MVAITMQFYTLLGFIMVSRPTSPFSLQSALTGTVQNSRNNRNHINPDRMRGLMHMLMTSAPPHLMILLYDDTISGLETALYVHFELTVPSSVVNIEQDLSPVTSILSSPLSAASSVRRHIWVACSLQNVEAIFKMVTSNNFESSQTWWIVLALEDVVFNVLRELIREGTQVIVVQLNSQSNVQLLYSNIDNAGKIRFDLRESLMQTKAVSEKNDIPQVFIDLDSLYSDFKGRELIATVNNNQPFIFIEKKKNGTIVLSSGFEGSIIRALSDALNFTYRVRSPDDGKWGGPIGNGSVVGMIGDVFYRKAHFALCEITITRLRESVIDFTYPYYLESLTLVSRAPREKNKAFAVFAPFTSEVWLYLIISVCVMGIIMYLQITAVNKDSLMKSEYQPPEKAFLSVYGSLLKQDSLLLTSNSLMRFSLISWYLFSLIVSALYSGMLIATLVKPSFELPINGLTDLPLAIRNGFTLVVTADTSSEYLFKSAKGGIYAETWELFNHEERQKSFPQNSDNSYDGILTDKLVFIAGETGAMYRAMTRGIRRYYFARDTFSPQFYGMACFSGAPFLSVFNKMLSYMVEGGLIDKWLDEELQEISGNNVDDERSGPKSLTLTELQAAYYVLAIGYTAALVSLLMEAIIIRLYIINRH